MIKSLSPESIACKPVADQSSKKPLNLGISLFSPVSSVPGSATFLLFQPLLTVKIPCAVGFVIAAQIFIVLAERFFGLKSRAFQTGPLILPNQTIKTSLSDFQNFLVTLSNNNAEPSTDTSASTTEQTIPGTMSGKLPQIPLVLSLTVYNRFTNEPYSSFVALQFPLFTFPNIRGALPVLILELLTTIFVRTAVPPETTSAKPID